MPPLRKLLMKLPQTQQDELEVQLEGLKRWVRATGGKVIYKQ